MLGCSRYYIIMIMLLSHLHNYSSMVLIIEIYIIGLCYIINFMIPYLKQLILLLLTLQHPSQRKLFFAMMLFVCCRLSLLYGWLSIPTCPPFERLPFISSPNHHPQSSLCVFDRSRNLASDSFRLMHTRVFRKISIQEKWIMKQRICLAAIFSHSVRSV